MMNTIIYSTLEHSGVSRSGSVRDSMMNTIIYSTLSHSFNVSHKKKKKKKKVKAAPVCLLFRAAMKQVFFVNVRVLLERKKAWLEFARGKLPEIRVFPRIRLIRQPTSSLQLLKNFSLLNE